jgi:hypothetical protein
MSSAERLARLAGPARSSEDAAWTRDDPLAHLDQRRDLNMVSTFTILYA